MVELIKHGVYLLDGQKVVEDTTGMPSADEARENTITYGILRAMTSMVARARRCTSALMR